MTHIISIQFMQYGISFFIISGEILWFERFLHDLSSSLVNIWLRWLKIQEKEDMGLDLDGLGLDTAGHMAHGLIIIMEREVSR